MNHGSTMRHPVMNPRKFGFHAGVIGGIGVLTIVLTYPLILHLTTHIPAHRAYGKDVGDPWAFLWAFGFVERLITDAPQWSLFTEAIFYPRGVDLLYPLVFGFGLPLAVSIPFVHVLGVILTYNCFILAAFVATAYATFLLVRYLTHDNCAAVISGVIFAFAPYHLARSLVTFNFATSGMWIPLYILVLLKSIQSGQGRYVILAPLILALTFASNPYYAIFLGLFTIFYLIYYLVVHRGPEVRRSVLRRLIGMGGLMVLFLVPFAWLLLAHPRDDAILFSHVEDTFQWGADLLAFFIPSWHHSLVGDLVGPLYARFTGNDTEQTVYVGYTVLALAAVAAWKAPRAETRLWLLIALAFFVLALGPFLHIAGQHRFTVGNVELFLPLPDYLMYQYLPFLRGARVSSRFAVVLMLALAVLAGYGTRYLLWRWAGRSWASGLLTGLLLALIIGEFSIVPMPLADARVPEAYERIAKEPGRGETLIDVPLDWGIAKFEYYQTLHRKRLLLGQAPRISLDLVVKYADSIPLVPLFKHPELIERYDQAPIDRRDVSRFLEFFDLGFIVIHKNLLDPAAYDRFRRFDKAPADLTPLRGPEILARFMQFLQAHFPIARLEDDGERVIVYLARDVPAVDGLIGHDGYLVDFGSIVPQFFFAVGWSDPEQWDTLTVAWSNAKESRLGVYFPRVEDLAMELRLLPVNVPDRPTQAAKLYVNEEFIGEIELDNDGWRTYTLALPKGYLKQGMNTFRFVYRYTASPLVPATGQVDGRQLGVAFDYIHFRPQ